MSELEARSDERGEAAYIAVMIRVFWSGSSKGSAATKFCGAIAVFDAGAWPSLEALRSEAFWITRDARQGGLSSADVSVLHSVKGETRGGSSVYLNLTAPQPMSDETATSLAGRAREAARESLRRLGGAEPADLSEQESFDAWKAVQTVSAMESGLAPKARAMAEREGLAKALGAPRDRVGTGGGL